MRLVATEIAGNAAGAEEWQQRDATLHAEHEKICTAWSVGMRKALFATPLVRERDSCNDRTMRHRDATPAQIQNRHDAPYVTATDTLEQNGVPKRNTNNNTT